MTTYYYIIIIISSHHNDNNNNVIYTLNTLKNITLDSHIYAAGVI